MAAVHLVITGWRVGLRKISMTRALQRHAGLGLTEAKAATDRVLGGGRVSLEMPSLESAQRLAELLSAVGAEVAVSGGGVSSDEEFFEDFGASLTAEDLQRLLERARATGDREVRLLVKQYQTLQRAAADFLTDVDEREQVSEQRTPGTPVDYPRGFLRVLLQDVPRTPRVR